MKQLKKTLLTLVALLAVTTGAWADSVTMKEITGSDIQSSWNGNTDPVKATDLPGFKAMTHDEAIALGAPSNDELVYLIYAINASNKFAALIYEYGTKSSYEAQFNLNDLQNTAQNYWVYYTYSDAPAGLEVAWDKASNTGSFTMPGGNVTLEPEYYPQATLAFQGLTAAEDAAAKTDAPLAVLADGAVTGGTLMYYVATDKNFSQADAIALAETEWSAAIPTAETVEAAGTCYVWYYIKGDAEHSDTDPVPLAVTLLPEPTYAVTFAEGTDPNEWTADPNTGVTKGQQVTVTYTGSKKVIGVKAEKKSGGLLTLSACGETIYYAEGETWAEAIQNHPTENQGWEIFDGNVTHKNLGYLFQNDDFVPGTAKIDPNASYSNGSI